MKSPMDMAPNKMVSPAKKNIKNPSAKQKAAFDVNKDGNVTGAEMGSVFNMNSPAKMGSAYKMDKSSFKMKSAPVNMRTPGSVAKMAGVSPMKEPSNQAKADRLNSMADKYSDNEAFRAAQTKYNQAALNDKTSGKVKKK